MNDADRFASLLLHSATRAFDVLDDAERTVCLQALDAFVAAPGATTFVQAHRALIEAQRTHRIRVLQEAGARDSYRRGRDAIDRSPLDAQVKARLKSIPMDPKAGRRLEALASLVGAYTELAARAEEATRQLRVQMEQMRSRPPKSVPPTRNSTPPGRKSSKPPTRKTVVSVAPKRVGR